MSLFKCPFAVKVDGIEVENVKSIDYENGNLKIEILIDESEIINHLKDKKKVSEILFENSNKKIVYKNNTRENLKISMEEFRVVILTLEYRVESFYMAGVYSSKNDDVFKQNIVWKL